ncbi:MAG TPA: tetratricopeptide repeat protein [Chthoniobacterales bacterium]|nr:tetratricopeptide repeat protein [Chthoniobacterales bacterium]
MRSSWLKAVAAIELRNFDYAISLLQGILKQEPEFLTGRQLLRRAEVAKHKGDRRALFNISTSAISIMKAQRELKKNPGRAVEIIEKVLEDEPYNRQANLVLKQAALAAGWPEIGVFALQTLLEEKAHDTKILHELGRLYHELGESEKEVEIYHRITEIDSTDAEAARLGKDASARASMKTGGWTRAESYRDLIKDKEAAVSLEQQGRLVQADASLEQQIEAAFTRHQAEPQSVDRARKLAELHALKGDLENAIAWYQYAADLTNNSDAGLAQKISDLQRKRSEREIADHEEFLATHGAQDQLFADRSEALVLAKRNHAAFLVDDARKRSERNPADLQLRFELGEYLFSAGRFREALPELQRARQNPTARLKSMNLLGCCYRELGMLDLAQKQLEEAAREIGSMDAMKKEITYNLGLVYELMGDSDKSIAAMKQIYQTDYGYRDVAARVEASYQRPVPDR